MVVPDSNYIAEIILFGEGFNNTKILAKKVYTLYSLAVQQLSKQVSYVASGNTETVTKRSS